MSSCACCRSGPKPDPSTFLGAGKIETLAASCAETDVDVVIFDNELTPAQLRQIEEEVGRKIIDRTQLILDIFARRARTREGKLQVELAQLKYLLPRLVGAGDALSRLGGGIGTRGPGETKLETDRRRIRTRIHAISDDIEQVRQRALAAARAAAQGVGADGRAGRLHQRRQDDAVQRADAGGRRGVGRAVRHARSAGPAGAAARQPRAAGVRHGRLHRSPAARAGGGVSRDARGDRGCRPGAARHRRGGARPRPADDARCSRCSRRSARSTSRCSRSTTSATRSRPTSGGGCRIRIRRRCASRRCSGEGIDELIETIASRLALDVRRVTLTFDPDDAGGSRADRPPLPACRVSCCTRRATARSRSSPTCRAGSWPARRLRRAAAR